MTHAATHAKRFKPHRVEAVVEQYRDEDDLTYLIEYALDGYALVQVYDVSGAFLGYL